MSWDIESTSTEELWTAELLDSVVASMPAPLPAAEQRLGSTTVQWWESDPGVAVIMAHGGSIDDCVLAEQVVKIELEAHGYRRAQFSFDQDPEQGQVIDEKGRPVGQEERAPVPVRLHYPDQGEIIDGEIIGFRQLRGGDWEVRIQTTMLHDLRDGQQYPLNPPQITNILKSDIDAGNIQIEILGGNSTQLGGPAQQLPPTFGSLIKAADWSDIMNKAKRLIQSEQVTVLRNGYNVVAAHVIGDHGEYNVEIGRDDPNSRAITTWTCECPWDQYAWQRTRKWKKYEGRPCAHVLAAYWKALGTPLDDYNPDEHGPIGPGQKLGPEPGQGREPAPGLKITPINDGEIPKPPNAPGPPRGPRGPMIPGGAGPPDAVGQPPGPAQAPMAQPPGVLPPSPMEQLQMMQPAIPGQTPGGMPAPPGSVSVPGAKMPSPFNPLQAPGTYSQVNDPKLGELLEQYRQQFWGGAASIHPEEVQGLCTEYAHELRDFLTQHGVEAQVTYLDSPDEIGYTDRTNEAEGEGHAVVETGPYVIDFSAAQYGYQEFPMILQKTPQGFQRVAQEFQPPEIVRLQNDVYGVMVGKSDAHGNGQYTKVPAGSTGEVIYQDPTTQWVEVIFPLDDAGELEPYHVQCFVEPSDIQSTRIRPPGPFIRRK